MKIGLDKACFAAIDMNGDIKADRQISFDYLPAFSYTQTSEKTDRENHGKEERVENRGSAPIKHKVS